MSERDAGDDRSEQQTTRQSVESQARDASNRAERPSLSEPERAPETPTNRSDQRPPAEAQEREASTERATADPGNRAERPNLAPMERGGATQVEQPEQPRDREIAALREKLAEPVSYPERADDEARLARLEREAAGDRVADPGNRSERPRLDPAVRREGGPVERPEQSRQREIAALEAKLARPVSYAGRDADMRRLAQLRQIEERRANLPRVLEATEQNLRAEFGDKLRSVYAVRTDGVIEAYDIRVKIRVSEPLPEPLTPGLPGVPTVPRSTPFPPEIDVSIGLYDVKDGKVLVGSAWRDPRSRDVNAPVPYLVDQGRKVVAEAVRDRDRKETTVAKAAAGAVLAGMGGALARGAVRVAGGLAARIAARRAAAGAGGALGAGALRQTIERAAESQVIRAASEAAGGLASGSASGGALEAGGAGRTAADSARVGRSAGEAASEQPIVYKHALNRGGLEDILANQRLRSTQASAVAGGQDGVRAYVGRVEGPLTGDKVVIEFTTDLKPTPRRFFGEEGAQWSIPEGEYLPIRVLRVLYPDGRIRTFGADGSETWTKAGGE